MVYSGVNVVYTWCIHPLYTHVLTVYTPVFTQRGNTNVPKNHLYQAVGLQKPVSLHSADVCLYAWHETPNEYNMGWVLRFENPTNLISGK